MEKPNHERKSRGFREKLQQSAKNITSGERKAKSPKTPAQKRATRRKVWGVIGTICLVGVLTIAIFVGIFLYYVNKTMKGSIEVPMSEYKPAVSTEMYYDKNAGTGEKEDWYMYQTLYYEQNRIWVDLGQIPDYLQQAAIAIEDKRFESHHGVDWYGTMRAIVRTLTGGSMQGGSTITQQTIKNITGDNQDNVKRKIMEIYRALALEKEYSKDDILEVYLNTIYLGEMCYGVQTASQAYFGKDAADLTLAESACLIGITNNPSMYDPLLSDWTRENNRNRQLTILKAMLDQNKISNEEYEAAKNEEVVFTDGYTCLGAYARDKENINGGLLMNVTPADFGSAHPLAGVALQRRLEEAAFALGGGDYRAPCQRVEDFLAGRPSTGPGRVQPSYRPGVVWTDLHRCLPDFVSRALEQALPLLGGKLAGYDQPDAVLTAVETRSSSPVRILRDENYESNIRGLYPCGEGAGYAGGILSAAADGMRAAEKLWEVYEK